MLPVPKDEHVPPAAPAHVQWHEVSGAWNVSLTVARLTASGPAFDAVIV
jgi:6,7-dimethyl-8-ribityllumazine synthase